MRSPFVPTPPTTFSVVSGSTKRRPYGTNEVLHTTCIVCNIQYAIYRTTIATALRTGRNQKQNLAGKEARSNERPNGTSTLATEKAGPERNPPKGQFRSQADRDLNGLHGMHEPPVGTGTRSTGTNYAEKLFVFVKGQASRRRAPSSCSARFTIERRTSAASSSVSVRSRAASPIDTVTLLFPSPSLGLL